VLLCWDLSAWCEQLVCHGVCSWLSGTQTPLAMAILYPKGLS
jgi:hypothetical protein